MRARTGHAIADHHGLAISGSVETLNYGTLPPARSRYLEQVRQIAPPELHGREDEMSELAAFCRGTIPYAWWRAPAWAGKSALMASFVLNPPPAVRVVSFFITARYADNSDRQAFVDVVLEQLAELVGEPVPTQLGRTNQTAHFLGLLADAAEVCAARDERLVLVVDGLDEDRGVVFGPDAHSVAALLPAKAPPNVRVLVAGRPNPPIPSDVPGGHPLRNPSIVRPLTTSPSASEVRLAAQRELANLLHGNAAEQDLLGLLTAARGGLSGADLAELTGWTVWEVSGRLAAVSGRTFTTRGGRWRPETTVYLLGHEELQQQAVEFLGAARLASYRERLHEWADQYLEQQWPSSTPEYLLRGYHRLLRTTGDLVRLVEFSTDPHRHDRMFDLTSGDVAALSQIVATEEIVCGQEDVDLVTLGRLVFHRMHLTSRNAAVPTELIAVWVALGDVERAEAIARSTASAMADHGDVLDALVSAVCRTGDFDHAEEIARSVDEPKALVAFVEALAAVDADRAETVTFSVADAAHRDRILVALASAVDSQRGESLARSISSSTHRSTALAALAEAAAESGDFDRAKLLANSIDDVYRQGNALIAVARRAAEAGCYDKVKRVFAHITSPLQQETALFEIVPSLVASGNPDRSVAVVRFLAVHNQIKERAFLEAAVAGDLDRAEEIASVAHDEYPRDAILAVLARTAAAAGDVARAWRILGTIANRVSRESNIDALVRSVAATGDLDRVKKLVGAIPAETWTEAWHSLASALATAGRARQAMELAEQAPGPLRARFLLDSIAAIAAHDGIGPAEQLARSIENARDRAEALATLARFLVEQPDRARAAALAAEAERTARATFADSVVQLQFLALFARALKRTGDFGDLVTRAEMLVGAVPPAEHMGALMALTDVLAATGDLDRAEPFAPSVSSPRDRMRPLKTVVQAQAWADDLDQAEKLVSSLPDYYWQQEAHADLVRAAVAVGDLNRAERVIRRGPIDHGDISVAIRALVWRGEVDRAVRLALDCSEASPFEDPVIALVEAVAVNSDLSRAERQFAEMHDGKSQNKAWAGLTRALGTNDLERAVSSLGNSSDEVRAALAPAIAARNVDRAIELVLTMENELVAARARVALARMLVARGDFGRAEGLLASIVHRRERIRSFADRFPNTSGITGRRLAAQALRTEFDLDSLKVLARVEPAAIWAMIEEHEKIGHAARRTG